MRGKTSALVGLLLSACAVVAQAAPIVWTLEEVAFDDGGTAVGSFIFDADTSTYFSVSITTTAGSAYDGASYSTGDVSTTLFGGSDEMGLRLVRNNGESLLGLDFLSPLTNAGGSILLDRDGAGIYFEGDCSDPACGSGSIFRELTGGSLLGTVVPIPAAAWLFGSALLGLGVLKRKNA